MTLYVYGGGAVWKLDKAAQKAVASGEDWHVVAKDTGARLTFNKRLGESLWSRCPSSLYIGSDGRLYSTTPRVDVYHFDHPDEIANACMRAQKRTE